jgi:hypothetical protein
MVYCCLLFQFLARDGRAGHFISFQHFSVHSLTVEDNRNINWAWDNIRVNIKISTQEGVGYCELDHHKPCFNSNVQNCSVKGTRPKNYG